VLVLVSLNALEPLATPKNIPYRSNVIGLDPKTFTEFFGFTEGLEKEFLENVQLAQNATIKEYMRGKLERRANLSKDIISQNYRNTQNDFIQALKRLKKTYLIEYDGDGSRIIDYV
jgi:hypothetical protein